VLVDDLLLAVAFQENAEGVEPGHDALQPDAIGEKDRHGRPPPLEVLEERILKSVDIVFGHFLLLSPQPQCSAANASG